jgi:formylglycine-generating enzyme required for sulfatase activity
MTSSGFRKPAADPGLDALGALLQGLHERGLSVGVDEAARVARVFQHARDWPRDKRVRVLEALLARGDAERLLIDQFERLLVVDALREALPRESAQAPTPIRSAPFVAPVPPDVEPRPRQRSSTGRSLVAGAAAALVMAAAAVWMRGRFDRHAKHVPSVPNGSEPTAVVGRTAASTPIAHPARTPPATVLPPPGPRMVRIPAGTFQMGSNDGDEDEKPVHSVTLPSFEMDVTEVTVADYQACVAAKACPPAFTTVSWPVMTFEIEKTLNPLCNAARKGRELHPINCVDWNQARAYCQWDGKRLPTEEECEYAARGSEGRKYPWGDVAPEPELLNGCGRECVEMAEGEGWTWTSSMYAGNDGYADTAPVGSFPKGKSPFGVLDMAGNVWEWTETKYCDSYAASKNCTEIRVVRGGSWGDISPSSARATNRSKFVASSRSSLLGFRCVR